MPRRYQFRIVATVTVTAETQAQAREAAMIAKADVPDALRHEWPAKVRPGRTKLVSVPAYRAK